MDGSADLRFAYGSYQEAEELYKYLMDKW